MKPIDSKIAGTLQPSPVASTLRPTRRLIQSLPYLSVDNAIRGPDFERSPRALLAAIGDDAEATMSTIHLGLGAIGQLLAHASPEAEDRTISADSLESLGFLMAELGDLAAACMTLAAHCRRAASAQSNGAE